MSSIARSPESFVAGKMIISENQPAPSAESRSTSASTRASEDGSLPKQGLPFPPSSSPKAESRPSINELPDYDYPVPFVIRNTFIDVPRPLSFEEFYAERKIHSCPVAPPPGLEMGSGVVSEEEVTSQLRRAMVQGSGMMASAAAAAAAASAAAAAATMCWMTKPSSMQSPITPHAVPAAVAAPPSESAPVLRLADALGCPELGSLEMPTAGSAGHRLGTCRPCAFYHSKGCGNGVDCTFCHLCPPGEKKRRQKTKAEARRMGFEMYNA